MNNQRNTSFNNSANTATGLLDLIPFVGTETKPSRVSTRLQNAAASKARRVKLAGPPMAERSFSKTALQEPVETYVQSRARGGNEQNHTQNSNHGAANQQPVKSASKVSKMKSMVDRFADRVASKMVGETNTATKQANIETNFGKQGDSKSALTPKNGGSQMAGRSHTQAMPMPVKINPQEMAKATMATSIPAPSNPPAPSDPNGQKPNSSVSETGAQRQAQMHAAANVGQTSKGPEGNLNGNSAPENQGFVSVSPPESFKQNWQYVVADISLEAPAGILQFETVAKPVEEFGKTAMVEILGLAGNMPFKLIVDAALVESLIMAHDPEVKHFTDKPQDLALILEFVARELVERVEKYLKVKVEAKTAQLVQELPQENWMFVQCEISNRPLTVGLAISVGLAGELERFVTNTSNRVERGTSKMLRVMVGPVSLPLKEALHTTSGDILDCGANPEGDVFGILLRSDGHYWPVQIEDNTITLNGDLQPPLAPSDPSEILAEFELGHITLAHHLRRGFKNGTKIGMNRLTDNRVNVWFGNRKHGSGTLDVIDNSLCVALDTIGEAQ